MLPPLGGLNNKESRQQEEETPLCLTHEWIWLGGLLHRQSHGTTIRPPQEMRDGLHDGYSPDKFVANRHHPTL